MARKKIDLRRRQARLELVVKLAHEELEEIEADLAALEGTVRLDEAFFWKYLTEILRHRPTGATSSEITRILTEEYRLNISVGGLRVFLSRYKKRDMLTFGRSERDRWELSPSTINEIAKLETN